MENPVEVKNFSLQHERGKISSSVGNFFAKIKNIFIHVYDAICYFFFNIEKKVVLEDDRMDWLKEYTILRHLGNSYSDKVDFVLLNVKSNKFFIENCVRVNYKTQEIININLKKNFFSDYNRIDIRDAENVANDIIFLEDYSTRQEKERVNE